MANCSALVEVWQRNVLKYYAVIEIVILLLLNTENKLTVVHGEVGGQVGGTGGEGAKRYKLLVVKFKGPEDKSTA